MTIISSDGNRFVDVGSSDIWHSLSSTIISRLDYYQHEIPLAINFLNKGICKAKDASVTAKQFNMVRDELSRFKPSDVVYDLNDPQREVPWKDEINDVITSCANYYITADGKDLLFEIVSILCYAGLLDVEVSIIT